MEKQHAPSIRDKANSERVLWLTNLAAPYRVPLWKQLGKQYDLRVGLLESNSSLLTDSGANRGRDWLHAPTDDVQYVELPTWKVSRGEARYYFLRDFSAIKHIRGSDVVLFGGWESPAYWLLAILAIFFRVGRVGFYESPVNTMRHRTGPVAWVRRMYFRSMHAVVTPGPAASHSLTQMGVPAESIFEGFNAVDVQAFHRSSAVTDAAGTVSVTATGHSFLYVGQLITRKRVNAIIDAFSLVARAEDRLTIVGSGSLEEELREHARNQHAHVSFAPAIDNRTLPHIMAQHQTLVLASESEVWGLVVNEALATGMHAVVSSNCGVAASVDGMQGVYLTSSDLSDLPARMHESRQQWAGRIARPVILDFTPERFAGRFTDAFQVASGKTARMPADGG